MDCCCEEKGLGAQEAHTNLWTAFYNRYYNLLTVLRRIASLFSNAFTFRETSDDPLDVDFVPSVFATSPIQGSMLLSRIGNGIYDQNGEGR